MNDVATVLRAAATDASLALSGDQEALLSRYADLVLKWQRVVNLTGASNSVQFAREHIADSLATVPHMLGQTILDVGSGAGLPGVVLAVMSPDTQVVLLEPRARRARFLTQVRIELELGNVEVAPARVEDYVSARSFDCVVTRALGSLQDFLRLAARHRRPETTFVAMKAAIEQGDFDAAKALWGEARVVRLDVTDFRERNLVVFPAAT